MRAEFQVFADDEFIAEVSGPREQAWAEAMHYASQCLADGQEVQIEEIKREIVFGPNRPTPQCKEQEKS